MSALQCTFSRIRDELFEIRTVSRRSVSKQLPFARLVVPRQTDAVGFARRCVNVARYSNVERSVSFSVGVTRSFVHSLTRGATRCPEYPRGRKELDEEDDNDRSASGLIQNASAQIIILSLFLPFVFFLSPTLCPFPARSLFPLFLFLFRFPPSLLSFSSLFLFSSFLFLSFSFLFLSFSFLSRAPRLLFHSLCLFFSSSYS